MKRQPCAKGAASEKMLRQVQAGTLKGLLISEFTTLLPAQARAWGPSPKVQVGLSRVEVLSLPLRGPPSKRGFYQVSPRREEFLEDRLVPSQGACSR